MRQTAQMARRTRGFTLIELMIAVCIIGVLASVAIPAYTRFMMNARGSEGSTGLGQIYKGAAAYWERGAVGKGISSAGGSHCLVYEPTDCVGGAPLPVPWPIAHQKYDFATCPTFAALGFSRADPGYFSYGMDAMAEDLDADPDVVGAHADYCGTFTGVEFAYVFYAVSDIDEDGLWGGYSIGVHSTPDGGLRREAGYGDLFTGGDPHFPACPMCVPGVD